MTKGPDFRHLLREDLAEYLYYNYAKEVATQPDSFDVKPWDQVNHRVQDLWRNDAERLIRWMDTSMSRVLSENEAERLTTIWAVGKWMVERSE